jgi:NAD(P) transhydrogenase
MTSVIEYDLVVIGSGPGGQKAAVAAAKLGKSVAVIERGDVGGVCVNTGTIPSKSMREAVVYLTGVNQHELYGTSYRVKTGSRGRICMSEPSASSIEKST